MKRLFCALTDTSCQKRRKRKQRNTKHSNHLNETMGARLDLQSPAPLKILLVPCESQPSSATRYWIVDTRKQGKIPFFGSNRCKIVQHMGNRVTEPFHGHFVIREGRTVIKGILTDGAVEGKYFELVLQASPQQLNQPYWKNSTRKTSLCGFLQRSAKDEFGSFEETHDAFLHSAGETSEFLDTQEEMLTFAEQKVT